MHPPSPIALSPDGSALALGDGPELLAYRGTGEPAYKAFTDGILVGLVHTGEALISIDADGRISRWRHPDGVLLDSGLPPVPDARDLVAAPDGTLAVLTPAGAVLLSPDGSSWPVSAPGATAVSFGPDSNSLGIGTGEGRFTAFDRQSGSAWGTIQLEGPITGVGWSAQGAWIVAAGASIHRIQGDGQAVLSTLTAPGPLGRIAVSPDGMVVAATLPGTGAIVFDLHGGKIAGQIAVRRAVEDLALGTSMVLALGFEDGEASLIHLLNGHQGRTEPHAGRARTNWRVDNHVDAGVLRGAQVLHQAQGAPIARYVPPPEERGAGGCIGGCAGVAVLVMLLSLTCAGMLGLMYILRSTGLWELIPIR